MGALWDWGLLGTDLRVDTDTLTATGLEWHGVTRHIAAFTVAPDEHQPVPERHLRSATAPIRRTRRRAGQTDS